MSIPNRLPEVFGSPLFYVNRLHVRNSLLLKHADKRTSFPLIRITCSILVFGFISTGTGQEHSSLPSLPQTLSQEAKDFLIRTKGDIINNYILRDGKLILEEKYRRAVPSLRFTESDIGGVKVFWVSSEKASGNKFVIVNFHGGGHVEGDARGDGGTLLPIYEHLGVRGLSVEYRLAPKHPFPAAIDDAVAVYRGLLKTYRPSQIAFTGDSAGGNIALAAALKLRDDGDELPGAVVAISPGADLAYAHDSAITMARWDPFVDVDVARANGRLYVANTSIHHPLASPAFADYQGFPPLLIQVGTREVLLSDAVLVARRARDAGVDVTLDVWEGMWHSFHMTWPERIPEAQKACKYIADFLRQHLRT